MDVKLASYVFFVGYNEILTIFILFSFYTTFSDILQQFYFGTYHIVRETNFL